MVSLEHLADELILEILSNLEHDKKALKQVALVCSRLHRLAQPLMVRHLGLTLNNNPSSFDRFVRSVNQNPDLATMVRTIELFWFQRGPKAHKSINALLAKLTRLRGLSLSTFADTTPYQPDFLQYNKLKDVSEVALSDTFLTIETVARFMFLDRIKVMTIEALPDQAVPAVPDSYVKAMKTSPLVDLYFNWECFLALDVLAKFLEAPEALQRLTSPTPGTLQLTSGTRRIMTNILSPCSISHALSPTFDSLVDLTITDRFFPIFSGHDSTRLNLHEFTRLKTCRVPANLFFHDEEAHPSRNGLYKVFPGSLEILELFFYPEFGILSKYFEISDDFENTDPEKLNWLIELATHKRSHLHSLERVQVREIAEHGNNKYAVISCSIPPPIQETFIECKIELEMWIRLRVLGW